LRAVFVNHCHPDTPHVCAVRLREFAHAMAARGHRIVLLTATLAPDDAGDDPAALPTALAAHDWTAPFRLACRPMPAPLTERLQAHRLPPPLSKAVALWCYAAKGGVFWTWTAASRPFWQPLARAFRPDVVWATFGNVDALDIARGLAAAAGCPWVLDIKDPWDAFIPPPLRAVIARRYAGAAALTALSEAHRDGAAARFAMPATVIYSGIAADRIDAVAPPDDGTFRLVLSGSTYDARDLALLVDGLGDWLHRTGAGSGTEFIYAGGDHARVAAAIGRLGSACRLRVLPTIDPPALARLQAGAAANLYIKGRATPFHHKLIELLAAGRPIICCPAETAEAACIAAAVGGRLYSCADAAALAGAFDAVRAGSGGPISLDRAALNGYTWAAQAARLEDALAAARRNAKENG
jgi:glycosyltransferase involved in cell wall biosynthesis